MSLTVCGIGIVSAMGMNVEETIQTMKSGKRGVAKLSLFDSLVDVPVAEVKRTNRELKELLGIDARKCYSRTALLGMMAAQQAMKDANIRSGARVGVISATTVGGMDLTENFYREFHANSSRGRLREVCGHDCVDHTIKIAECCGIHGFATTISTACSSAANAMIMGAHMLQKGMLDYVLVGGSDALCRFTLNGFNSLMILDPEPCKPFSNNRAGLNLGEGAGYLVLTRESGTAKQYCRLSGWANANDAYHQTASSNDGNGAFMAMSGALAMSGVLPEEVSYINAHGTGTPNNDSSESVAIKRLFKEKIPLFSSTKPFTGHTLAAAGGIEAVLSVVAIERGIVYPNLGFTEAIEGVGLTPCVDFMTEKEILHVMTNSFGFGGNNTTLIFSK